MKKQLTIAVLMAASLALTACAKSDNEPELAEEVLLAEVESACCDSGNTLIEAQPAAIDAVIDSIDQQILDEKKH